MPENIVAAALAIFSGKVNGLLAALKGLASRKGPSRKSEQQRIAELEEIYSGIPEVACVDGCGECCGLISMSRLEEDRIRRFLEERHLDIQFSNDPLDVTYLKAVYGDNRCYFLDERQMCLVYPVRPIICRLYGAAENMRCPYAGPAACLSEEEALRLIRKVNNI
jgi:Fe-S-cluster containining protein